MPAGRGVRIGFRGVATDGGLPRRSRLGTPLAGNPECGYATGSSA